MDISLIIILTSAASILIYEGVRMLMHETPENNAKKGSGGSEPDVIEYNPKNYHSKK